MLGHRNVSALYFEYGSMKTLDSPLIGFSSFLDSVVAMTSGLERDSLADAIFAAIDAAGSSINDYRYRNSYNREGRINYTKHPSWGNYHSIKNLATAKDPTLRKQEIEAIVSAIESATEQYWSKLNKWLGKIFPEDLDLAIVSGGASRFLEPEIEQYFNCQPIRRSSSDSDASYYDRCFDTNEYEDLNPNYHLTPVVWGGGLQKRVEATFNLTDTSRSSSYRLIDAYGLFDYLLGKNSLNKSSEPDVASEEE